jgi:hypothetical protein
MDQLFQVVLNILLQVNHTNQALLNYILMWLDHLENNAEYHLSMNKYKAMEVRTLLDNMATTWYIQQLDTTKNN